MSVSRASGEPVARYSFHAASTASGRTAFPADWNGQRDPVRALELGDNTFANPVRWPLTFVVPMTSSASFFVLRPVPPEGSARNMLGPPQMVDVPFVVTSAGLTVMGFAGSRSSATGSDGSLSDCAISVAHP